MSAPSAPIESSLGDVVRRRVTALLAQISGAELEGLHPAIMNDVERALLQTVLEHTAGHRDRAARVLGLHRNTLRTRLRALDLDRGDA